MRPRLLAVALVMTIALDARAGQIAWSVSTVVTTHDFVGDPLFGGMQPTHGYHYVQSIGGQESAGFFLNGLDRMFDDHIVTASAMGLSTFYDISPYDSRFGVSGVGGDFQVDATFTDVASGESGTMSWRGSVYGDVGPDHYRLFTTLDSPALQTRWLGGHHYDATFGDPTGLNGATGVDGGLFPLAVVVHNPEPTTWVLSSVGLACIGALTWRRQASRH